MNSAVEAFLAAPVTEATTAPLRALWHAAHNNWQAAHAQVDHLSDRESMWVHAHLHREEGDQWNAEYWYRKAGEPVFKGGILDEREELIATLLR